MKNMTTPHNPHKTPESNLTETGDYSVNGSIASGIAGNYPFSVRAIISEAWSKTSGFKGTCWLAFLFYALAFFPLSLVIEFGMQNMGLISAPGVTATWQQMLFKIISALAIMPLTLPLALGLCMLGIKRAAGTTVVAKEIFFYFPKVTRLFLTMLLLYLLCLIGLMLFILPGIYLMVAYSLALPLVVEKNLSPWQALETSRKAITHHWFRFFGLYLVMTLIFILATIPIGIGLIWVAPMFFVVNGIVYRNIFGLGSDPT
ncbi:MAG: putative membrane protein [Burkholderiaceae bacterium]